MSEHERTGKRDLGFSEYMRFLISPGRALRDVTRHINIDFAWYCAACIRSFALIEDKFRQSNPPRPLVKGEWRATRQMATDLGIAALGIAWTNEQGDSRLPPTNVDIQLCIGGSFLEIADHNTERLLIKLFEKHREHCPARAGEWWAAA